MFDGTYPTAKLRAMLALVPTGADDYTLYFSEGSTRITVQGAGAPGVHLTLDCRPDWARGSMIRNLTSREVNEFREQVEAFEGHRVWVHATRDSMSTREPTEY
jgi:hypothetical protein